MRLVCEFVVAQKGDAQIIANQNLEDSNYTYLRSFNLDLAGLAELYALSKDVAYDGEYINEFRLLAQSADQKANVMLIPRSFCQQVAALDVEHLPPRLLDWRVDPAVSPSDWDADHKTKLIHSLIRLARWCNTTSCPMLLKLYSR